MQKCWVKPRYRPANAADPAGVDILLLIEKPLAVSELVARAQGLNLAKETILTTIGSPIRRRLVHLFQ